MLTGLNVILGLVAIGLVTVAGMSAYLWTPDRSLELLKTRWAKPPSQFITVGGMDVHYRDEGPRDDPSPILLLHGTGNSLHTWDDWAKKLSGNRRVIRFDRPGFGLTGPNPNGDYGMPFFSQFTANFLDALKIDRVNVVGSSAGGRVALYLASRYPNRVERLVLIAAAGYPKNTPPQFAFRMAMSPWMSPILARILPRGSVEANVRNTYGDPSRVTQEVLDRSYELTLRAGNRRALGDNLRQAQDVDDAALIKSLHVPTLILWGTKDYVLAAAPDAERFHQDIAGSQLVMFEGLGHLPHEEDPVATLVAFETFRKGGTVAGPK